MASKHQDASSAGKVISNIMARCGHRKYSLVLKIVGLLLMVQFFYSIVYKRFENYGSSVDSQPLKLDKQVQKLPSHAHSTFDDVIQIRQDEIMPSLLNPNKSRINATTAPQLKKRWITSQGEIHHSNIPFNSNDGNNNATKLVATTTRSPAEIMYREVMANVATMFNTPHWKRKPNRSYIGKFRNQLSTLNTRNMFILSQLNVKEGQALYFSHNSNRNTVISKDLFQSLPKQAPFQEKPFARCSVVGSGGILTGSSCGADIDKAEYIFRCNAAPIKGFTYDAGSKTNITTLNPSAIWQRYHSLRSTSEKSKFLKAMQEQHAYTGILLPLFGTKSGYSTGRHITRMMKLAKRPPLRSLVIHPKHFTSMQNFWKKMGLEKRISTGFYLTSVAIALCREVFLYGFWPFPTDIYGNEVHYHYYESTENTGVAHDFLVEFRTLLQLHRDGVINLQIHPCEPKGG